MSTQEHLYMLHIQVKHMALWVRDATCDVDQLISVALKQMMLNVEVVCNFGTVLCTIPYDTLEIHDFYDSIRSFYIGLMDQLVNKYKKNNPFIINIAHSFESFLQVCDYLKPLPGSYMQFTAMMAAIICNVYNIDLEELKAAAHKVKDKPKIHEVEAGPSTQAVESQGELELSREELKAIIKEAHEKAIHEEKKKEDAFYMSKAGRVLERMGGKTSMDPGVKAALAEAMRKDEWEMHPGKFKWQMSERMSRRMGRRRGDLLTSSEEDHRRVFNHPNIQKRGDFLSFVCLVGLRIPFNMGNSLKWVSFLCNISACVCPYT